MPAKSATNVINVVVGPLPPVFLVSHWPLNESNGVVAHDIGPAHNDGTVTNAGTGTYVWTNGVEGSALAFTAPGTGLSPGNGGFVSISNSASLNFESTNPFSISAWMKTPPAYSGMSPLPGRWFSPGRISKEYELHYRTGTGIMVWIINNFSGSAGSGAAIQVSSGIPVADGNWHQVAFTYDGSGLAAGVKIYVDGTNDPAPVVFGNTLGTQTIQNNVNFNIGSRDDAAFHNFTGSIDDVQVYNTVLSSNNMLTVQNPGTAIFTIAPPVHFSTSPVAGGFNFAMERPGF